MLAPTIHLNGSSSTHLAEKISAARQAACALLHALSEAAPNGRDYYPQGDDAIRTAERDHRALVEKAQSIDRELAALADDIQGQVDARAARRGSR